MAEEAKAKEIDVAAITKSVTEAVTKTVIESLKPQLGAIDELAKNQKVLADTIAALPPAKADAKADAKTDGKADGKAEPLTVETVAKLVADGIAADRKAQADEAGKAQARKASVDKLVAEKLGGDAEFAALLTADTDEGLARQADVLAAKVKALKPDFGGASKDGGTTPNGTSTAVKPMGNLSEGTAKFAAQIKLPA